MQQKVKRFSSIFSGYTENSMTDSCKVDVHSNQFTRLQNHKNYVCNRTYNYDDPIAFTKDIFWIRLWLPDGEQAFLTLGI